MGIDTAGKTEGHMYPSELTFCGWCGSGGRGGCGEELSGGYLVDLSETLQGDLGHLRFLFPSPLAGWHPE